MKTIKCMHVVKHDKELGELKYYRKNFFPIFFFVLLITFCVATLMVWKGVFDLHGADYYKKMSGQTYKIIFNDAEQNENLQAALTQSQLMPTEIYEIVGSKNDSIDSVNIIKKETFDHLLQYIRKTNTWKIVFNEGVCLAKIYSDSIQIARNISYITEKKVPRAKHLIKKRIKKDDDFFIQLEYVDVPFNASNIWKFVWIFFLANFLSLFVVYLIITIIINSRYNFYSMTYSNTSNKIVKSVFSKSSSTEEEFKIWGKNTINQKIKEENDTKKSKGGPKIPLVVYFLFNAKIYYK